MNFKDDISFRASVLFILVLIFCFAILGKATYEQKVRGDLWKRVFAKFSIKKNVPIEAMRGTIYSDDNKILAASMPIYNVIVDMSVAKGYIKFDNSEMTKKLDSFFMEYSKLNGDYSAWTKLKKDFIEASKYKDASDKFFELEQNMSYEKYVMFKQLPYASLGKNKSGIIFKKAFKRIKPLPQIASIIIGKLKDNNATRGLEYGFDSVLRGVTGKQTIKLLGNNASMPIDIDGDVDLAPQNGSDIHTNINILMQEIAREELMKMLVKNQSLNGCAIVMETSTGKIKAMANLGLLRMDSTAIMSTQTRSEKDYDEYFNYSLMKNEPGSTMKLVTLLNLIEDGKINLNTPVDLENGKWFYAANAKPIEDAKPHPIRTTTVIDAFARSSNVGMAKLLNMGYASNRNLYLKKLNSLNINTNSADDFDLVWSNATRRIKWDFSTFLYAAFGYSITNSPLNTLRIYNAIANNGVMMKPYLVNQISNESNTIKVFQPEVVNSKLCSKSTCDALKKCLFNVCNVEGGTARNVFADNKFLVAGKTGTSLYQVEGLNYKNQIYQSSFVGYFPANNPKYTCLVIVVNKANSKLTHGGEVAAPVFKNIANRIFSVFVQDSTAAKNQFVSSYKNKFYFKGFNGDAAYIMQKIGAGYQANEIKFSDLVFASTNIKNIVATKQDIAPTIMPSLKGMNIKDAIYLCETMGLKVNLSGSGKVNSQSVNEGSKIAFGQQINLQLN